MKDKIDYSDIIQAQARIHEYTKPTPLIYSKSLSSILDANIYLKPECFQITGSFKARGACSIISSILPDLAGKELITCSSGNHGAALSYAASLFGNLPVKVFVPEGAENKKRERIASYGAEVLMRGKNFSETYEIAQKYTLENNAVYIHSHGDPLVIAGQGTIGLEISEELPQPDMIIVPVGGGGLISGIATAMKEKSPDTRIIGVETAAAPGAWLSFRDGYCHETVDINPSLADGLLGTLTPLTWSIASQLVSRIELVEEPQIRKAMRTLFEEEQLVVEGSGSVGLAAIMANKIDIRGKSVVLILTGRNIGPESFLTAISE